MTEMHKAAIKTLLVFLCLFIVLGIVGNIFDLHRTLFNSFLFDPGFVESTFWTHFILIFSVAFAGFMGLLGYKIAKKKSRNAQNWAGLCFLFNIWGVIFLCFLPTIDKDQRRAVED